VESAQGDAKTKRPRTSPRPPPPPPPPPRSSPTFCLPGRCGTWARRSSRRTRRTRTRRRSWGGCRLVAETDHQPDRRTN